MKRFVELVSKIHRDEQGAEGLEKLLIIAAVVLPILAVLIFFGGDIKEWLEENWSEVKSESESLEIEPDLN